MSDMSDAQVQEMAEAEGVMPPPDPNKSSERKIEDLQTKGNVLAKAWEDLFSFVTEYQAELSLKENLVDIAETEIEARQKQLEEMNPTADGVNEEFSDLKKELLEKDTELQKKTHELKLKEQVLEGVQSALKSSKELNNKLKMDLNLKKSHLLCKEGVEAHLISELKLKKEEVELKEFRLRNVQNEFMREKRQLQSQLQNEKKALELERNSLLMERKAHDQTKRSLSCGNGSGKESGSATLDFPVADNDSDDVIDNDFGDSGADYTPPLKKATRVSTRQKTRSVKLPPAKPKIKTEKVIPSAQAVSDTATSLESTKPEQVILITQADESDVPGTSSDTTLPSQTIIWTSTNNTITSSDGVFPLTLKIVEAGEETGETGMQEVGIMYVEDVETGPPAPESSVEGNAQAPKTTTMQTPEHSKTPRIKSKNTPRMVDLRGSRELHSTRSCWTDADMSMAVKDVQDGVCNAREASIRYNVPKATMNDRVKGRVKSLGLAECDTTPQLKREDELKLHEYIKESGKYGKAVNKTLVKEYAAKLAFEGGAYFSNPADFTDKWVRRVILRVKHAAPFRTRRFRANKEKFKAQESLDSSSQH